MSTLPTITVTEEGARLYIALPGRAWENAALRIAFREQFPAAYRQYVPARGRWSFAREKGTALRSWLGTLQDYHIVWEEEDGNT